MFSDIKFPSNLIVLLEPTADCNIRCRHCYHADTKYDFYKMPLETLEKFIKRCVPNYKFLKIIWHGGEPLLMGHKFFYEAYNIFAKYSEKYGTLIKFNVQTNGTLLDDKFIDFFISSNTAISISYDGPFNSILRQETEKTECAIKKLKDRGQKVFCLSTLSSKSINHLIDLYNFFKKENINIKFNPLFPDGAALCNREFIISKENWSKSFLELFENWFFDTECNIAVASCQELLKRSISTNLGCPGACLYQYIAVDGYGALYPCGRLIDSDFNICNINDIDDIRQTFLKDSYCKLVEKNQRRISKCINCKFLPRCQGGCNSTAQLGNGIDKHNEFDCYFNQKAFAHIDNLLNSNLDYTKINPYAIEILQKYK